ncbi:MAG: sulfatase, partial [Opitutaceae bacterium]
SPHGPWRALSADRAPYAAQGAAADFLGEMAAVDRAMGRLREELGRLGVRDDTLVWFNSDNGAAGGSAGPLTGGKGSLWEGGIRVPGIIEWPARVSRPLRTAVPAGTVDILPTVCDIAGVPVPAEAGPLDGESLRAVIEGRASARRSPLTFEMTRPADGRPSVAAAIDQQWKLLRVVNQLRRGKDGTGEPLPAGDHLFDVDADPAETRDLAQEHPEILARLRGRLDAAQRSFLESAAVYPEAPPVTRLEPRLLVRAAGIAQPLVDRLAFPMAAWTEIGSGTRRHADGALQLGGDVAARPGVHHAMDLANTFLQFSVRVGAGGRAALELGPVGAPVAEIMLDASGVAVRSRGGEPAAIAEVRTEGKADLWRNVLVEFLPGEIGVAVDGLPFLRASMAAVPVRRHEGFALTRHAGDVAFRDVWATTGEPAPDGAAGRGRGRRGKAAKGAGGEP